LKIPLEMAGMEIDEKPSSWVFFRLFHTHCLRSSSSFSIPSCQIGPTAWITFFAGSSPAPVLQGRTTRKERRHHHHSKKKHMAHRLGEERERARRRRRRSIHDDIAIMYLTILVDMNV